MEKGWSQGPDSCNEEIQDAYSCKERLKFRLLCFSVWLTQSCGCQVNYAEHLWKVFKRNSVKVLFRFLSDEIGWRLWINWFMWSCGLMMCLISKIRSLGVRRWVFICRDVIYSFKPSLSDVMKSFNWFLAWVLNNFGPIGWDSSRSEVKKGTEIIIKDNVELGWDETRLWVENQSNTFRVMWGVAKINPKASSWVGPILEHLVLQLIEDVSQEHIRGSHKCENLSVASKIQQCRRISSWVSSHQHQCANCSINLLQPVRQAATILL